MKLKCNECGAAVDLYTPGNTAMVCRNHIERIKRLEQLYHEAFNRADELEELCRDMYEAWCDDTQVSAARPLIAIRMKYLGLFEGESDG